LNVLSRDLLTIGFMHSGCQKRIGFWIYAWEIETLPVENCCNVGERTTNLAFRGEKDFTYEKIPVNPMLPRWSFYRYL